MNFESYLIIKKLYSKANWWENLTVVITSYESQNLSHIFKRFFSSRTINSKLIKKNI